MCAPEFTKNEKPITPPPDSFIITLKMQMHFDYHRELERKLPAVANVETADSEKIPLKSHMKIKADRVAELKKAVVRYNSTYVVQGEGVVTETDETEDKMMEDCGDAQYESDYNDDLV